MDSSPTTKNDLLKVAIAGPNGSLGPSILTALLTSTTPSFHLTLLTRDTTKTQALLNNLSTQHSLTITPENVTVKVIDDYLDQYTLRDTLAGTDALVILLNRDSGDQQISLIDAAITAHVSHIIPSSFGVGTQHPYLRTSPPLKEKIRMLDHLNSSIGSQSTPQDGRKTTFTAIDTGIFLELAMKMSVLFNLKSAHDDNAVTLVFDDGNARLATTSYADIAFATKNAVVLGVIDDERVRNKTLNVQTFCASQNELLRLAKDLVPERKWGTVGRDTKVLEAASKERFEKGERSPDALRGYLVRASFGLGLGAFERLDNEVLGIEEQGEEGLKDVLRSYM